jgi:hypothetical protein
MSNHGKFAGSKSSGAEQEIRKEDQAAMENESARTQMAEMKGRRLRYPDVQSAPRFPIKLPLAVKSELGSSCTETQNISANGVLFQMDAAMPVGSMVDFTISLPADVVGAPADVKIDCRGRVVRSTEEDGRRGVGVVIDEYRFERR